MYKDLSLKDRAKVIREGVRLGLNSIDDILSLYDEAISHKFAEGSIATPDWDPNNPYHYHTASGEKVVITPEDWEKHKGLPYFKQVEDAVLTELAAHPGPEYEINPQFSLALRQVYKGNMGPKYQNYSSFSGNLPEGYSFTPEGLISDNQGNLYVLRGFRQTPKFTYDESKPLMLQVLEGNNKGNVTFYPVNMEKTVKPALPVSSTMNVNKERDKAISEYIKDNTTHSTVNGTMYKEPYFYPDIDAVDYDWEEWKKEHPVQELRRAVTKDYLYDLIKLKALNHFIFADEEGLEYDPFWSEDEDWVNDSYMQELFDEKFNSYINKPINLIKLKSNITKKPTYAKAKQKAVIEVGPLLVDDVLTYAKGGKLILDNNGYYAHPKYNKDGTTNDMLIKGNSTGTSITTQGIPFKIAAWDNLGNYQELNPNGEYYFPGSMVREHALQLGGNTKPAFDLWYPTVPKQKNDTSSYDLRRAYNMLPFDEMEKFKTINDYHLPSVAYDEKTDTYTFLKRNGHPTLNYELDWYNSGSPDALEFRERYKLDTLSLPWRYIPNTFLTGGLAKKPEPIYNEKGQVIGRRYVNRDNPKITDSVVPQGRVNFQEFLKAKGKKARATNFEDLELFLDSLIARGYNEPLRLAFLATSYNEMDNKGAASKGIGGNGYMGFNTIRMPLNLLNDSSKLIQYILDDTEKLTPDNWTDGGSRGPYIKNLIDAFNKFWNETNPNAATLILNKANIRPAKLSDWYLRASDADLMKQYMEYPELSKEEEQKQKKSNKLLDSFVDFILSGGLQNTPSYADGGNLFKKGGIYIKPENRGKFTALKKRTGHSASWFKAHGTPALKKMATFALNARHWKHDEGGHLFLGDNSYLLTLFDKYGPNSLVIQIDKPVKLNEVLIVADAPKPGDKNYDRYIANTYDAWQRRDLFTPNGDIDINTLPTETRNRVRGYSGTIAALKGMDTAAKVAGITAAIPASIIGGINGAIYGAPYLMKGMDYLSNPLTTITKGLRLGSTPQSVALVGDKLIDFFGTEAAIANGINNLKYGKTRKGLTEIGLSALPIVSNARQFVKAKKMILQIPHNIFDDAINKATKVYDEDYLNAYKIPLRRSFLTTPRNKNPEVMFGGFERMPTAEGIAYQNNGFFKIELPNYSSFLYAGINDGLKALNNFVKKHNTPTVYHEVRHLYQPYNTGSFDIDVPLSVWDPSRGKYYTANTLHPLYNSSLYIFDKNINRGIVNSGWRSSPEEFDAQMGLFRLKNNLGDTRFYDWDINDQNKAIKQLSKEFHLSKDDTKKILFDMSKFGLF